MTDAAIVWTYIHSGIEFLRTSAAQYIPLPSDLTLLILAVVLAWILKRGRIVDTVIFVIMIVMIFLLLKLA